MFHVTCVWSDPVWGEPNFFYASLSLVHEQRHITTNQYQHMHNHNITTNQPLHHYNPSINLPHLYAENTQWGGRISFQSHGLARRRKIEVW